MKKYPERMFLHGRYSNNLASFTRIIYSFFFLLAFPVLIANCDIFSDSISGFVDYNTGTARGIDFTVTSVVSTNPLIKTNLAWLHNPDASLNKLGPGLVELEVKIDNPLKYDLAFNPVINDFIGEDEYAIPPPVSYVSLSSDTIRIQIGNAAQRVKQGDAFNIRLNIATKDGNRVFEPYMMPAQTNQGFPKIIFDNVLSSARDADIKSLSHEDAIDAGYSKKLTWKIQRPDEHAGINRIYISFISKTDESAFRKWEYKKVSNSEWVMDNIIPGGVNTLYSKLTPSGENYNEFELPFPLLYDTSDDIDAFEDYFFLITLQDKNGLTATAGDGVTVETTLMDFSMNYHYRNTPDSDYVNNDWAFPNGDRENFSFVVPFSVDKVQFVSVTNDEIFGSQQVRWAASAFSEDQKVYSLHVASPDLVDVNKFTMEVMYWENPAHDPTQEPDRRKRYTFTITRLNPNRDSTIKDLIIEDANTGTPYTVVDGFENLPDNMDYEGLVKTEYTVYVPSTVNRIKLMGDFLNTSRIYNDQGITLGLPNLGSSYPQSQRTLEEDPQYTGADYVTEIDLKIIRDGWYYDIPDPKVYTFYLNVKPENDNNETMTRHYIITVIKTDDKGNPDAKLENITIKTGNLGTGTVLLAPNWPANSFDSNLPNYTVYVPSSINSVIIDSVTIEAEAIKDEYRSDYNAEIRRITSVDLSNNQGDPISIAPTSKISNNQLVIGLGDQVKKRVTLTVYSIKENSTSRDYTITLIKNRSSNISEPRLTGDKNSLKLEWDNNDNYGTGTVNEVWYSLYTNDSAKDIPEKAIKVLSDNFTNGSSITGLKNNEKYNVWVRTVRVVNNNIDTVGDWKKAQTRKNYPDTSWDYGIPGAAELTGFSYTLNSSSTNYNLSPFSSANGGPYTLTVPSETTNVTITAQAETGVTYTGPIVLSNANLPAGEASGAQKITAYSPDMQTWKEYTISVFHTLPAPTSLSAPQNKAIDGKAELDWENIPYVDDVSYELYYHSLLLTNTDDIIGTATKWPVTDRPVIITNLVNAQSYNFWVRGVKGEKAGDWSSAGSFEPRSTANYLTDLEYNVNTAKLAPSVFNPNVTNYTLTLLSDTSSVRITGTKENKNQITIPDSGTSPTVWTDIDIETAGNKAEASIKVTPHSDKDTIEPPETETENTKEYKFKVYRMFPAPNVPVDTLIAKSNSIIVSGWDPVPDATPTHYEIYCGTGNEVKNAQKWGEAIPITANPPCTATLLGLTNETEYHIWVRAIRIIDEDNDIIPGEFAYCGSATPKMGTPVITVNFSGTPADHTFTLDTVWNENKDIKLSWMDDTELEITISQPVENPFEDPVYEWYIDGVCDNSEISAGITVHASDFGVAIHTISARITTGPAGDRHVYSKTLIFKVED